MRHALLLGLAACGEDRTVPTHPGYQDPDEGLVDAASFAETEPPVVFPTPGDPPRVACGTGDGAVCALPHSKCVGDWLVYYTNGTCAGSSCIYDTKYLMCGYPGCANGACVVPKGTAPP